MLQGFLRFLPLDPIDLSTVARRGWYAHKIVTNSFWAKFRREAHPKKTSQNALQRLRLRYFDCLLQSARTRAMRVRGTINVRRAVPEVSKRHGSPREFWDASLKACSTLQVRKAEIESPSQHCDPAHSSLTKVKVICICKTQRIWGKCVGCDALPADLEFC